MKPIVISATPSGRLRVTGPAALGSALPGARWNRHSSFWSVPSCAATWSDLASCGLPLELDEAACRARDAAARPEFSPREWPEQFEWYTPPFEHQRRMSAHIYSLPYTAVFAEAGTGKTKAAIDALRAAHAGGEIGLVVVVTPRTTRRSWAREWALHARDVLVVLLEPGRAPEAPESGRLTVWVASTESMSVGRVPRMLEDAVMRARINTGVALVVDEAHTMKNPTARRTANTREVARHCIRRCILTGTPVSNTLEDLYSLFAILDRRIIGLPDARAFQDRYCVLGGFQRRRVVGYRRTEELLALIEPFTFRATRAECLDLPPKTYEKRWVPVTAEHEAARHRVAAAGGGALLVITRALREHQIAGGWEFVGEGEPLAAVDEAKLDALEGVLEEAVGQAIVWCAYRHEVAAVVGRLLAAKVSTVSLVGGTEEGERWEAVDAFQSGRARVLVGIAASGGVGITLTAATTVVYYSNTFSYTVRSQSEDRAHRIGQTAPVLIVDLVREGSIDEVVLAALDHKLDLLEFILQTTPTEGNFDV